MSILSLGLALALAPTPTQVSLQAANQAPAPTENRYYAFLRSQGVSPAGIAIVSRMDSANAAEGRRIDSSLVAVNREVASIVEAPQVDVATLTEALGRRDGILAQRRTFSTRALLEALRAMTPADRAIVARNVGLPSLRGQAR